MINKAITDILKKRYLLKSEINELDMFKRVAKAISDVEVSKSEKTKAFEEYYNAMKNGNIMPNSPALMNLGTKNQMSSACFVLPVEDSMTGIFTAVHNSAMVHKHGGGTGFCFSTLRPKDDHIYSTDGKSSGPLSFLEVFNTATGTVKQAGKRRGANMGTFEISHPDIIEFIKAKDKDGVLSNFNLSVMLTDKFMLAVKNDENWELKWKNKIYKTIKAKVLFDLIVEQSWKNGEPGILFIDAINNEKIPKGFKKEKIIATNPCGEQPLESYGSCNLAAINLGNMISNETFDYDKFKQNVRIIIKMLDRIIDINDYPLPEIAEKSKETRRIGAGVMGFADLLIKLKIKYGSDESLNLIDKIMNEYKQIAEQVSIELNGKDGLRKHKALLTIAPTGTTSMFCNASSGIEPYFNYWYNRRIDDEDILVFEGITKGNISEKDKEYITNCFTKKIQIDYKKIDLPEYFVKSEEISWEKHIKVQSVFQKYVDSSISKTINMSNSATKQNVYDAIFMAWETKCKGVTVYRDGSRNEQVLSDIGSDKKEIIVKGEITLPAEMDGKTYRIKASLGKSKVDQSFYIHIGILNKQPVQLFIDYKHHIDNNETNLLKSQMIESLGMSISYQLRYGVPLTVIIKQLRKTPFIWLKSLHNKLAKILESFIEHKNDLCPNCGLGQLIFKEGCQSCNYCGYSKCD